eukprot:gnl/Chilomastix_cuspidata/1964.p1 GENE.gnl/Chilomastix_cuspidata/1964~~gnl/Chilomastix_cuspidata/1964.p1  ORF type:complete len:540 (+),score=255.31 gnl/Chilomastix_cuspidata/1964:45-1664(+)
MSTLRNFERIPHIQGLRIIGRFEYKMYLNGREVSHSHLPFRLFEKASYKNKNLIFKINPNIANAVSHICLFSSKARRNSKISMGTLNSEEDYSSLNAYGPFRMFHHAGWACIPMLLPAEHTSISLQPHGVRSSFFMGLQVEDVALLGRNSSFVPQLLPSPRLVTPLAPIAAHMFLESDRAPALAAIRFQQLLPPDMTFVSAEHEDVPAHSQLMRVRLTRKKLGVAPGASVALPFPTGLLRRALYFLYTGDIARLVGWFDAATKKLLGKDSTLAFLSSRLDMSHAQPSVLRNAFFLGALPFFLLAQATGARSLAFACIDYAAEAFANVPELHTHDVLAALLRVPRAPHDEYLEERFLQAIAIASPATVRALIKDTRVQVTCADRLFLTRHSAEQAIFSTLPRSYAPRGYDRALSEQMQRLERSLEFQDKAFGGDFLSSQYWTGILAAGATRVFVQTRPEIAKTRFGRPLPPGSFVPREAKVIAGRRVSLLGEDLRYPILRAVRPDGKKVFASGAEVIPVHDAVALCAAAPRARRMHGARK